MSHQREIPEGKEPSVMRHLAAFFNLSEKRRDTSSAMIHAIGDPLYDIGLIPDWSDPKPMPSQQGQGQAITGDASLFLESFKDRSPWGQFEDMGVDGADLIYMYQP